MFGSCKNVRNLIKMCFLEHFLECNQIPENIFFSQKYFHLKLFYTKKIFYTETNTTLMMPQIVVMAALLTWLAKETYLSSLENKEFYIFTLSFSIEHFSAFLLFFWECGTENYILYPTYAMYLLVWDSRRWKWKIKASCV